MGAKKQSNLKKVDTWVDIVKNEHEVLDFWKDADIFNKLRAQNKGGRKWSFLDGPMTANKKKTTLSSRVSHSKRFLNVCSPFPSSSRRSSRPSLAREAQKLKIRQPLAKMILGPADEIGLKAANRFQDILKDDLNVKFIEILAPGTPSPLDYEIKLNFRAAGPKFGKQIKEVAAALTANHDLVIAKARAGESVELTISTGPVSVAPEEIIMQALPNPDLAIAEEAGYWTAFDTHMTEELRVEGFMRDCMRKFQLTRKETGLEIEDHIHLTWQSDSSTLIAMFEAWGDQMAAGLLALSINRSNDAQAVAFEIEGEKMTFGIVKA